MRSLKVEHYEAAEVARRLREDHPIRVDFVICDRYGNEKVALPAGDAGILRDAGADITANFDAQVKSTLSVAGRDLTGLLDFPYKRGLQVYGAIGMPDDGWARYPLGRYYYLGDEAEITPLAGGVVDEIFTMRLPDGTGFLEWTGPSSRAGSAFEVQKGERGTDAINRALAMAGFPGRVPTSPETFQKFYSWGADRPKTVKQYQKKIQKLQSKQPKKRKARRLNERRIKALETHVAEWEIDTSPVTWLSIINDICEACGFYGIWFDWTGQPRLSSPRDPTTAQPGIEFRYADDGLITSTVTTSQDLSHLANEITVRPQKGKHVTVNADQVAPNHPLAPNKSGVLIPDTVDEPIPMSTAALRAKGTRMVLDRMGGYRKAQWEAIWHPGMEPFDTVALGMSGSRYFDQLTPMQSCNMTIGLDDLGVVHEARALFPAAVEPTRAVPITLGGIIDSLLLENDDDILLENGDLVLLESSS